MRRSQGSAQQLKRQQLAEQGRAQTIQGGQPPHPPLKKPRMCRSRGSAPIAGLSRYLSGENMGGMIMSCRGTRRGGGAHHVSQYVRAGAGRAQGEGTGCRQEHVGRWWTWPVSEPTYKQPGSGDRGEWQQVVSHGCNRQGQAGLQIASQRAPHAPKAPRQPENDNTCL